FSTLSLCSLVFCVVFFVFFFFFFSSRRRHTRFSRDWSSDVCSSDLSGRSMREPSSGAQRLEAAVDVLHRLERRDLPRERGLELLVVQQRDLQGHDAVEQR